MAPKKRATASSSRAPQQQPQQQQQQQPDVYASDKARTAATDHARRSIARERTMALAAPQLFHIDRLGWRGFVGAVRSRPSEALAREFYANLAGQDMVGDVVFVRGEEIVISAAAINAFYELPAIPEDEDGYSQIMAHPPEPAAVSTLLTGQDHGLMPDWRNITRGLLTPEAKNWAYFVEARLMPANRGSGVHRTRALLVYAIMSGLTMDVGRIIRRELHTAATEGRANRSMGFPSLISSLCHAAGVDVTPLDPRDTLDDMQPITTEMYAPDEKVKASRRRQRSPEEKDEEQQEEEQHDDEQPHEMDHDQGDHHQGQGHSDQP